jgi:hypothetical protein
MGRYPNAQAKVLKETPELRERLMRMQPDELEAALANPKVLKQTIAKAKVTNQVVGQKIEKLSPALRKKLEQNYVSYKDKDGKWIIRQRDGQGLNLHVDEHGVIQPGPANNVNPLRDSTADMKKALIAEGKEVIDGQPIHHLRNCSGGIDQGVEEKARYC